MIIQPKIRGFLCVSAHPEGCARHVADQVAVVRKKGQMSHGPKKVLIIGASTGYGLATRIATAFGAGASTLGLFYERPGTENRPASAGWYNTRAFEEEAFAAGLYAKSINGDAFSENIKQQTIACIRRDLGQVDTVIYSLASPVRTHPQTGETFRSVLKPIGEKSFTAKSLDTDRKVVEEVTIAPASQDEIDATVAVMGGEDWEMWMAALLDGGVLADGVRTLAYSYIGPEVTWPVYHKGTIGRAKADLERAAAAIGKSLAAKGGNAWVAVDKAVVTQASSAIPVVPLYISLLFKVMKKQGTHEDCIEQMDRLFREKLTPDGAITDDGNRIRLDDWEMNPKVQEEIDRLWQQVNTENLDVLTDFAGYQENFLRLFGFGLKGVDYDADTDPTVRIPSIST